MDLDKNISDAQGRELDPALEPGRIAPWLKKHIYISEACVHDECDQCPGFCAFCDEECLCPHHHEALKEALTNA